MCNACGVDGNAEGLYKIRDCYNDDCGFYCCMKCKKRIIKINFHQIDDDDFDRLEQSFYKVCKKHYESCFVELNFDDEKDLLFCEKHSS